MIRLWFLMAWIMTQGTQKGAGAECGGVLTAERGVIQTPNFPHKFAVPLHCRWVIDASQQASPEGYSIVVYFTQLFVSSGLSFTEFDYYEADSTFQLGGRLIHTVTEQNVTSVQWLLTHRHYLVIDLTMDRLEGNHLRVLDDLLDVFGFNLTYETSRTVSNTSCSVVGCSLSGHCYAAHDFGEYWCDCFPGFAGDDCGHGPLCSEDSVCLNGAACRQVGAAAVVCLCPEGFTGPKCETRLQHDGCEEDGGCTRQCPEDDLMEPCSCGVNTSPVTRERARYEGTVRLTNVSAVRSCLESASCSLKTLLTKQITKYLRSSNLSVMEDLRVIDIGFSGEVRFHFWGGKRDGSRVRESLNRLVQKGRLGNVTLVPTHLAITQEPTLHLQSVKLNLPRPVVRQGEKFVLNCVAQGSSHLTFRWFKDDVLINTTRARRNIWSRLLPLDSSEQYTALLGVELADPLDGGRYTCQVTDWGYQQCKSVVLEVLRPPEIRLDPITVTVEKGDQVTVKCTSPNELQYEDRFGYSWTRNNALFKMTPNQEFWEDLYPGGSILRIYNVQKSAVYSCHVHGAVRSVSRSVRLELLNRSVVPWCAASGSLGDAVRWRWAGPGVTAREECPYQYQGIASRLCLLVDKGQAAWQTPDYSECISDKVSSITDDFHRVTLGYGNSTAADTLLALLKALHGRGTIYPGEGEPVVALLGRLVEYLNTSATLDDVTRATDHLYGVVNSLLLQRNSIIHHQKVEELQNVVTQWARLWGALGGTDSAHVALDSLVVDMFRYDEGSSSLPRLRRGLTVTLPNTSLSYPAWYSSRVNLYVEANKKNQNGTSSVSVITYNRLTEFLPQRYSQVLENGSEVQYEVASSLVSVVARGAVRVVPEVELLWTQRPGWELRCGATLTPSATWNLTICSAAAYSHNVTLCTCPTLGTYAALLVKVINLSESPKKRSSARIVLVGCVCCLVQSLVALSLLTLRWYRHTTCLLFLKLQCCAATATAMIAFLYATSSTLPQESFPVVSTMLQAAVMVSLSTHLSKVLLIYTEVYLPSIRHIRQTIICIITGVPLLVVLCNHIAQTTTDSPLPSWWLTPGSMVYYTCTAYIVFLLSSFMFLFYLVTKRLRSLTVKGSDSKKAILRRQGLLNRAAVVLSATVIMSASSFIYINKPSTRAQYLFSFTSALLGFVILMCYVLHCESPLHLNLLRALKLDNSFSSESDSSPLNIFTKHEAERECEGTPLTGLDTDGQHPRTAPLRNGKAEPVKEAPPILKTKTDDHCRTPTRPKAVTFHNDLVTGCDRGAVEPVNMEMYPASPRKYPGYLPTTEGSARVCVITSVVVDTPSVVVCSVDVEPCSVLSQSIVHTGVAHEPPTPPPAASDDEGDVMDRICHDLDYLLGGLPQEIKAEIPRPEETDVTTVGLIQQTSL